MLFNSITMMGILTRVYALSHMTPKHLLISKELWLRFSKHQLCKTPELPGIVRFVNELGFQKLRIIIYECILLSLDRCIW